MSRWRGCDTPNKVRHTFVASATWEDVAGLTGATQFWIHSIEFVNESTTSDIRYRFGTTGTHTLVRYTTDGNGWWQEPIPEGMSFPILTTNKVQVYGTIGETALITWYTPWEV